MAAKEPKKPLIVYLDPEDRRKLDAIAGEEDSSPSAIARRVIRKALAGK